MSAQVLFACSKCFSRHPFEELSKSSQLCKECRGAFPIVKCTYCRSEFQQTSKSSTTSICKKCEQNVKQHGKPTACKLCNIIAAFIKGVCQRCTNSEMKYGPAVQCEQCKQRCAFNRPDHKIDGKLLCWLCTLSYKRALTKAKQVESDRRRAKKRPADNNVPVSSSGPTSNNNKTVSSVGQTGAVGGGNPNKKPAIQQPQRSENNKAPLSEIPEKLAKNNGSGGAVGNNGFVDPNSSDHVVAMTNLKETIASLQKKVQLKERELLQKDKEITELKAKNFTSEQELRKAAKEQEKRYELKIELLNKKMAGQLKEIATLSKSAKNPRGASVLSAGSGGSSSSVSASAGKVDKQEKQDSDNTANSSGGSGTESPSTN